MRPSYKMILLLVPLSLGACAVSKPRYISAACPPQWTIPANLAQPPQAPQALTALETSLNNLTSALRKLQQPVSTTRPSSPASSN